MTDDEHVNETRVDDDVDSMLNEYREIRQRQGHVPSRYFWANQNEQDKLLQSSDAEAARFESQIGMGANLLHSSLMELNLLEAGASRSREQLLLRAARKGYTFLVRELLCPSEVNIENDGIATMACSCTPVSVNFLDQNKNTILHLAVLSLNVSLVKWILRYVKSMEQEEENRWEESRWNLDRWIDMLNLQLETVFSLAIRTGKKKMVNAIGSFHSSLYSYVICWSSEQERQRAGLNQFWQPSSDRQLRHSHLKDHIVHWREHTEESNKFFIDHVTRYFAFLDARADSNVEIRDAVDSISRPSHLSRIHSSSILKQRSEWSSSIKGNFSGILAPWWDTHLSSFNIQDYVASRTEEELEGLFQLLSWVIQNGCMDDALLLLDYLKAPPSLMSIRGKYYYDIDWYVQHSAKLTELAIEGWVAQRVFEMRSKNDAKSSHFSHHDVQRIVEEMFGSSERGNNFRTMHSLLKIQWGEVQILHRGEERSWNMNSSWQELHSSLPEVKKLSSESIFVVSPRDFAALKWACSLPVEDFESSDQAQVLKFFLQTTYRKDPNFLSVDLPNLSRFVTLDHLPFFQFLTKLRDGQERPFLDLAMPLFCPSTIDSDQVMEGGAENEDTADQCCICLDFMENPYCLECGHSFHHKCFFDYAFPDLRQGQQDDPDGGAHKVLSACPHLSFKLGSTSCPYCRQSVKPSLPEAFALNLADGLKRRKSERQKRPCAPHLDLRVGSIGITVGETLLAFSACAGAISIFQWLVKECNIDPKSVNAGGVNIMHHAIAHKQVFIVRWLLEFGYGDMLFGGMDRDSFDNFIPSLTPGKTLEDLSTLLEDGPTLQRLKVLSELFKLRSRSGGDELTTKEQEVVGNVPTEDEMEIVRCRREIESKSPMHYLVMNGLHGFDTIAQNDFFALLRSKNVSAIPANWYSLSLAFSLDSTMRSDAKAFVSRKILQIPSRIEDAFVQIPFRYADLIEDVLPASSWRMNEKAFEGVLAVSTCSKFEDVLVSNTIDYLSPIAIASNTEYYNLWELLLREEKDWRLFLQVATGCNAWEKYCEFDWFEDTDDDETLGRIIAFIEAVIYSARVDVLAAFAKMESFCDSDSSYGGLFDLFTDEQGSRFSKALRTIVAARGRMNTFLPFFQHVDLVKTVIDDSDLAVTKVSEDIIAGKPLKEVLAYVDSQRAVIQSLPEVRPPLGIGLYDKVLARLDLCQTDWLEHTCYIDREHISVFDAIVERRDTNMYWWILSLVMEHVDKSNNDESGTVFVFKASKKIVETGSIFALEEFIAFCIGPKGPVRYQNKKHLLMADLLNIGGRVIQVHDRCDDETSEGVGGILGDIFLSMLVIQSVFFYDYQENGSFKAEPTIEKIESMFSMVEFVLAQPDITRLLTAKEARAKVLANIFDGALSDMKFYASQSLPHVIFRMLSLLKSKGFDLTRTVGEHNLITLFFYIYGDENIEKVPSDVLDQLCAGDEYKDGNGKTIKSKLDLVRWLALSADVSMQHLVYQDVGSGNWRHLLSEKPMFITESEFNDLKNEQLVKINSLVPSSTC